ncbi:FMN-binding negative transcriptional regulator [Cognatishimia sp. F0-27]|uniref:FMN-binding negative transcriptional regulator n=1 Tax=Cognatishimia sp. F0-27 TaxID=2816855 RepID=UPI001D0C228C|nr:FMN-binding negative transcriptional regulator [Cognatishimia sp. F0-27]MCC1491317.1 FMN-binding negative transcriptional regulator [Cognatishimia sp. F0-27]
MHPNPIFRGTDAARSLAFAAERGFGTLALSTDTAPLLSHVPFLLAEDGAWADLHLVRSNPIARALRDGARPATLAVIGPDGYVSPDWYETDDQVPTWNYVAVHLTGDLEALPPATMDDMLARQSAAYEARLSKRPWTTDKLTERTHASLLRQILPFRLRIKDLQSTWKLNQNKPDAARLSAAAQVRHGLGSELDALADLMTRPPQKS